MKVSLTLPALERLIAGDTAIEVEIRQQIAEQFAKRHLKTILNDATWKAASAQWHKELDASVKEVMQQLQGGRNADKAAEQAARYYPLRDAIERAAAAAVDAAVEKTVASQKFHMERIVKDCVNVAMEKSIEKMVQEGIQKRLQAAMGTPVV